MQPMRQQSLPGAGFSLNQHGTVSGRNSLRHLGQASDGRTPPQKGVQGGATVVSILRQLTSLGVRSLVSQPPSLEELFLRHYQTAPLASSGASR